MTTDSSKLIDALVSLIKIDSVESQAKEGKPFGEGVFAALSHALSLAESFGFETHNYDGYVGEVVYGEGEEMAILCHLDVVPTGDEAKWTYPPFSGTIANGYVFGRGTIDDKGPFIATLFALKRLKDEGFVSKKQIRLILGCDEESGWGCIKHYNSIRKMPETGFSPDASFPVIYAEKGIFHAKYFFDFDKTKLFEISGGVAPNVVCDYAKAKCFISDKSAKKFGLKVSGDVIESFGKTAHGSEPQKGENALKPLISYLEEIGAIESVVREFLFDDKLGLKNYHDETGYLTMSPDMIDIENGKLAVTVDMRYPSTVNFEEILKKLESVTTPTVISHQKPLFNDKNSPLIQTLCRVYEKHSGKTCEPIAIGGGTYARALKLGAGFGPETDDEPMLAHQPNECISIERMFFLEKVYFDAIKELTNAEKI